MYKYIENDISSRIEMEPLENQVVNAVHERLESERGTAVEDGGTILHHADVVLERDEIIAVPEAVVDCETEEKKAQPDETDEKQQVLQR